ncbi:MAG: hypothetical protein AB8G15_11085 [Saprospiraceae bacterium]
MGRLSFKIWKFRLVATTIIESMVAMVIIVLSFGVGMMIYMNVIGGDQLIAKTKADILLQEELVQTKKMKRLYDETKRVEGMILAKEVTPYLDQENAFVVVVKAIDPAGVTIREIKEVIYATDEK